MTKRAAEFEVTVRLRNNRLKKARRELGFNQTQMAAAVGIGVMTYVRLECMTLSPLGATGGYRRVALSVAEFLREDPDYLFSKSVQAVKQNETVRELDAIQILGLLPAPPENPLERLETLSDLNYLTEGMEKLTAQESRVIQGRLNNEHHLEIGKKNNISRVRVQQLEQDALGKLRRFVVKKRLSDCLPEDRTRLQKQLLDEELIRRQAVNERSRQRFRQKQAIAERREKAAQLREEKPSEDV